MVAPLAPIPVSVLTGFLGSGKTTLLNALLKDPALTDTAVIVNEVGEISIDHMLVESATDGVIELAGGCLCCTVRGDLVDTLASLVDGAQTGRIASLKRVMVETTGLADPVPVLAALMAHPALMQAFRLDGVIATVDAVNGAATLARHGEAARQAAVADRIVLTKTDLPEGETAQDELRAMLRGLNPGAPILLAAEGEANVAALFDCGLYDPATKTADVGRWLRDAAADDGHAHHHHDGHDHHDHDCHHDEHRHGSIRTMALSHPAPVAYAAIETFLDILRSAHGDKLLRLKAVVELADDPARPLVIHGVQRLIHPPARLPTWPEGPRGVRMVVIADGLDETYVRRLFDAVTGRPAPDTPDRTALADNPLAVAGFRS